MSIYKLVFEKNETGHYYATLVVSLPEGVDPKRVDLDLFDDLDVEFEFDDGDEEVEIACAEIIDAKPDVVLVKDEDGDLVIQEEVE